jgi:putative ABC transport system substrate-binding protein
VVAQQRSRIRRIGFLAPITTYAEKDLWDALADLGYRRGDNLEVEYRAAEGNFETLPVLAAQLVERKVELIVAMRTQAAIAAKRATSTIPIVMVNATDPVEAGLVASLARPGGNVTGLSQQLTPEIRAKQLQLLKEALPRVLRVAVLRSPVTTVDLEAYESAGQALAMRVQVVEIGSSDDLARIFAAMARDRVEAIVVPGDPLLFADRQRVVGLASAHRLPGMYSLREFTEAGGLMSYSARLTEQFRRAAVYVVKILRGASPATLPVESPSQYELAINMKTARTLGLTLPPSLMVRADEIIE